MSSFFTRGDSFTLPKGRLLFQDGSPYVPGMLDALYIMEGEVSYVKKSNQNKYVQIKLSTHDLVGLDGAYNGRYPVTALVSAPTTFYRWPKDEFELLIGMDIEFAVRVITSLSRHQRLVNKEVLERIAGQQDTHDTVDAVIEKVFDVTDQQGVDSDASIQYGLYNLAFQGKDHVSDELFQKFGREYKSGDIFFNEGDPGQELFLLLNGNVQVSKGDMILGTMKDGDIFGEMAIFENKPRSATIKALTDTRALALTRDNFKMIFQLHPTWALQLIQSFSTRITHSYELLSQ